MRAVRIPTGISADVRFLAAVSTNIINMAPVRLETGRRYPWFTPDSFLQIWGITSPTHPIMPETVTHPAVVRVANKITSHLVL